MSAAPSGSDASRENLVLREPPKPEREALAGLQTGRMGLPDSSSIVPRALDAPASMGPPLPVRAAEPAPFAIQVAAMRDASTALDFVDSHPTADADLFTVRVELPGEGVWYRVMLGRFKDREEAGRYMISQKVRSSFPGSFVQKIQTAAR